MQNTTIDVVKVPQLYAKTKELSQIFSISERSVWYLIAEMEKDKKWAKGIITYGKMMRVKISVFEEFFKSKSYV